MKIFTFQFGTNLMGARTRKNTENIYLHSNMVLI